MECPTCHRAEPCPTCGEYDPVLSGAPRAWRFKLYRRVIDGLHKLRLSYRRKSTVLSDDLSDIIRKTEANEEASVDVDDEETELH